MIVLKTLSPPFPEAHCMVGHFTQEGPSKCNWQVVTERMKQGIFSKKKKRRRKWWKILRPVFKLRKNLTLTITCIFRSEKSIIHYFQLHLQINTEFNTLYATTMKDLWFFPKLILFNSKNWPLLIYFLHFISWNTNLKS